MMQLVELGAGLPGDLLDLEDADYDAVGMKKLEKNRLHKALQTL
jgi:hypothetical protein